MLFPFLYGTFSLPSPCLSVFPWDLPPPVPPCGPTGREVQCVPWGWPLNTLNIRLEVRTRIWHQWNDFMFTNPGTTSHCPRVWKDRQPGSRPAAVGLCRLRLAHTLAVSTVSKFCWGWLKWEKSLCRPHTRVSGTMRKQLCLRKGACPLSLWLRWGSHSLTERLWPGSCSHTAETWTWWAAMCCHTSHHTSTPEVGARQNTEQEGEGCRGKRASAAQHTAWAEWQLLWDFSMAHLAFFPELLLNLIPTSGYLIEKEAKTWGWR